VRTSIFIVCGFLLWGACLGAARLILGLGAASMATATVVFVAAWFIVAAVNMAVGILKAGYSFGEEFPIFCSYSRSRRWPRFLSIGSGWAC